MTTNRFRIENSMIFSIMVYSPLVGSGQSSWFAVGSRGLTNVASASFFSISSGLRLALPMHPLQHKKDRLTAEGDLDGHAHRAEGDPRDWANPLGERQFPIGCG